MPTTSDPAQKKIGVTADDPRLEQRIRELEQKVSEAGGFLSPTLTVVVGGGEIGVESDAPLGEPLVRLPPASLVPVAGGMLGVEGNDIVLCDGAGLSKLQREILDCMLAIFNATGKLRQQQSALPWLALADERPLLEHLHLGRLHAPKPTRYFELVRREEHHALLLESFIGSRTLGFRENPDAEAQQVLMPFIDFFNHHAGCLPFTKFDSDLGVRCSRPSEEAGECFVRYNRMDSLDAYLNYGFADVSARFVRSVPVTVKIDGIGEIDIRSRVAQPRVNPLPESLAYLEGFVPRFQKTSPDVLVAAEFLIPTRDVHRMLGGALTFMMRAIDPALDGPRLVVALESAVTQILQANIAYYKELDGIAHAVTERKHVRPVFGQLDALLKHQASLLLATQNALSINPNVFNGVVPSS